MAMFQGTFSQMIKFRIFFVMLVIGALLGMAVPCLMAGTLAGAAFPALVLAMLIIIAVDLDVAKSEIDVSGGELRYRCKWLLVNRRELALFVFVSLALGFAPTWLMVPVLRLPTGIFMGIGLAICVFIGERWH